MYDLPWHKMKVSEQKQVIFMIQKAAKPNLMKLLFIGSLNLETFSTVSKAFFRVHFD